MQAQRRVESRDAGPTRVQARHVRAYVITPPYGEAGSRSLIKIKQSLMVVLPQVHGYLWQNGYK